MRRNSGAAVESSSSACAFGHATGRGTRRRLWLGRNRSPMRGPTSRQRAATGRRPACVGPDDASVLRRAVAARERELVGRVDLDLPGVRGRTDAVRGHPIGEQLSLTSQDRDHHRRDCSAVITGGASTACCRPDPALSIDGRRPDIVGRESGRSPRWSSTGHRRPRQRARCRPDPVLSIVGRSTRPSTLLRWSRELGA